MGIYRTRLIQSIYFVLRLHTAPMMYTISQALGIPDENDSDRLSCTGDHLLIIHCCPTKRITLFERRGPAYIWIPRYILSVFQPVRRHCIISLVLCHVDWVIIRVSVVSK
uniref:Putative secreted protein n=1 Tax=Ixodes scapularis TaxID=6945 RepID=A0A4D5RI07_IXOSC